MLFPLLGILVLLVLSMSIIAAAFRAVGVVARFIMPSLHVQPLPPIAPSMPAAQRCRRSNCRAVNPTHARFCRQCGMAMTASMVDHRVAKKNGQPGNVVEQHAASRLAG